MDWGKSVNRLQLDQKPLPDQEIDPTLTNIPSLVTYRNRLLSLELYASQPELNGQGFLVHTFQEPRPEVAMNFDRRPDYCPGQFINSLVRFDIGALGVLAVHFAPTHMSRSRT